MKVKVISLPNIFQVLYVLCFTRSRYQVSVYRTIGPLVSIPFWVDRQLQRTDNMTFFDFHAPNFEKVGDILVSACPCVCVRVWGIEISS